MKLRQFLVKLINLYQRYISVFTKRNCVFYPTCSEYTKEAVTKYGVFRGIYLGFLRILRCHPWQDARVDPLK